MYKNVRINFDESAPREEWERAPACTFKGTKATLNGGYEHDFEARFDLFIIREAWDRGVDFELEADGFGPGFGTAGDWSAIRDSSNEAISAMFEKAINHFFGGE